MQKPYEEEETLGDEERPKAPFKLRHFVEMKIIIMTKIVQIMYYVTAIQIFILLLIEQSKHLLKAVKNQVFPNAHGTKYPRPLLPCKNNQIYDVQ